MLEHLGKNYLTWPFLTSPILQVPHLQAYTTMMCANTEERMEYVLHHLPLFVLPKCSVFILRQDALKALFHLNLNVSAMDILIIFKKLFSIFTFYFLNC